MKEFLQTVLPFAQAFATIAWMVIVAGWLATTVFYLARVVRHRGKSELVFPLWKKGGEERFSGSAFWVWLVIPSCLLVMFVPVALPGQVTIVMARSGMFWTSVTGSVIAVFTNYYLNHSDRTPGIFAGIGNIFDSRGARGTEGEPSGGRQGMNTP